MAGIVLGQPSVPTSEGLPIGAQCEEKVLPFELCNQNAQGGANISMTVAQLLSLAITGATANALTFSSGEAITGAAPQSVRQGSINTACVGQSIMLDDGTSCPVVCDANGVIVAPNGGTNKFALSCGGQAELGCGPHSCANNILLTDVITVVPGAALTGQFTICLCKINGVIIDPTTATK